MSASNEQRPGPEGPGDPDHPPQSLGTHADDHLNQRSIAGADPFHSTAPDGALEQPPTPGPDTNAENFPFSRTYSDENAPGGPQGPGGPQNRSTRVISHREFTDVTGRWVQVRVFGTHDAGIRRAWVNRTLAQALARVGRDSESEDGAPVGVPAPVEPPDLSSGVACALPDQTPALAA